VKKHIIFKYLEVQNFKSVGEVQKINFDEFSGLTFINGINNDIEPKMISIDGKATEVTTKNGAGKSTLIDAILFCLYGKTISNSNNYNLQNRKVGVKLKTYVTLNLEISGTNYIITSRLLNKGKNKTIAIEITIDDNEPLELNTPQAKAYIENEILSCSYDLFKSAIVISNSSYVDFYDMKKSERVKYVEQLFDLDCFGNLLKAVRVDLNASKNKLNNININMVNLGFELTKMEEEFSNFDGAKQIKLTEHETNLKSIATEIRKIQGTLKLVDYKSLDDLNKKQKEILTSYNDYNQKKITLDSNLQTLNSQSDMIIENILEHKTVLELLCKDCLNKVSDALDLLASQNKLATIKERITKIEKTVPLLNTRLKKLEDELNAVNVEQIKTTELNHNIDLIKTKLEYKIEELKSTKKIYDDEKLRKNPYAAIVESTKEKVENIKDEIKTLGIFTLELQALEIMAGEDGAKANLLDDLAKNINLSIQSYLDRFGNRYTVKFDSSFDPVFVTTSGECSISEFSAGERQRINLATMMTFRDLIVGGHVSSNLFILDEILDSKVDIFAIESILTILREKSMVDDQKIWIISHNSDLVSIGEFDHKITANKTNDKTVYKFEHLR